MLRSEGSAWVCGLLGLDFEGTGLKRVGSGFPVLRRHPCRVQKCCRTLALVIRRSMQRHGRHARLEPVMLTHRNGNKPRSTPTDASSVTCTKTLRGHTRCTDGPCREPWCCFSRRQVRTWILIPAYKEPVKIFMGRDKVESGCSLY